MLSMPQNFGKYVLKSMVHHPQLFSLFFFLFLFLFSELGMIKMSLSDTNAILPPRYALRYVVYIPLTILLVFDYSSSV